MLDTEMWIGLFVLTAVLYSLKWIQGRRKNTVYRISPESLRRSKRVLLDVLPLVEDEEESLLDTSRLPYPKDNIKSAVKILAYYFSRQQQHEELERVKNCFVSLSRFQSADLDPETQQRRAESERKRLARELQSFMTNSPFKASKAA